MTDKVKAALNWWRDYGTHQRHPYSDSVLEKVALLANAYAALHPPDDDEPVSLDEARQIISDKACEWLRLSHKIDDSGGLSGSIVAWTIGGEQVFLNPTRGQLRRLLSALGDQR